MTMMTDGTAAAATDEDLAAAAGRRGHDAAAAFESLVRRYTVRLLGLLRANGVPDGRWEDVAQDAWLRAWRALPAWRPDHFRGWLFRVARTAAEDDRRRTSLRPAVADGAALAAVTGSGPPPDRVAAGREAAVKLAACLQQLKPDFRAVVAGHSGGESYEALAARLSVPLGTVQSRLNRAREALRKCLGVQAP